MSKHYGVIAFTDAVRDVQRDYGSNGIYDRKRVQGKAVPGVDALGEDEKDYLAERDHFYLATVSETGWPYVQYRGGSTGFLRVVDDRLDDDGRAMLGDQDGDQPVASTPSVGRTSAAISSTSAPAT